MKAGSPRSPVEIVGVLAAARDREAAGVQDSGHGVRQPVPMTRIAKHRREPLGRAQAPHGHGQQKEATVQGDSSAIERGGCDLFASNGWKREPQQPIVSHGGCGGPGAVKRVGFDNRILCHINPLDYTRRPRTEVVMNKTG